MSRSNRGMHFGFGLLLMLGVSSAWAQVAGGPTKDARLENIEGGISEPQTRATISTVNDPAAAELLFKEGTPVVSILEDLNKKGFHIEYKEKQFVPAMTLLSIPESTKIDDVLREILEPWAFRVYRSATGKLIVVPEKKSKAQLALEAGAKEAKVQE